MSNTKDYNVNLFKPHNAYGKDNNKVILYMICIWAVAVFGFHVLLNITSKPTPEKGLITFQAIWPRVAGNNATVDDSKEMSKIVLSVLGKNIAVKPDHKKVLGESLSSLVYGFLPAEKKSLMDNVQANGAELTKLASEAIGLESQGLDTIRSLWIAPSLVNAASADISSANKEALPKVMELYMTHNQGFLTDARVLGFPFHYLYTSQLLLILFVLLCLFYCIIIEKIHVKHGFIEDEGK